MSFSTPFILRPIGTALLAAGLFLLGATAYFHLPVASLPTVDFPTLRVQASRPGADPETMAATIAAPLERRLGEIAGVTELTSVSSQGSTNISIQFDLSRSIDGAAARRAGRAQRRGGRSAERPAAGADVPQIQSLGLARADPGDDLADPVAEPLSMMRPTPWSPSASRKSTAWRRST